MELEHKHVFTVNDMATFLNLSPTTVYRMCKDGQIPHMRIRHRIMFDRYTIEKWLQQSQK